MAEALVTAVRTLASNDSYKAIASLIDEVPSLKRQVESKTKDSDDLRAEIASLKTRHQGRLQEDLELYRSQHNKLEAEKTELGKSILTLNATICERDEATATLNKTLKSFQSQLDLSGQSLDGEKKKLELANIDITALQQSLKKKDTEIDKLKKDLRNEKDQVSKANDQLQDVQKKNATLQQKLQLNTDRLSEIEGFAAELHDEDEAVWFKKMGDLWASARQLVDSHFQKDLSDRSLEHVVAWKRLRESRYLDRLIPLPQSNSPAAKQMRTAALLAIIARCIDSHIFKPTYFLDEEDVIRGLLVRLAVENSKKETFCRSLLLSISPEEQAENAVKGVEKVIRVVAWHVQELIPGADYEKFRTGLEQVVQQARQFWHIMQHSRERYEPNFELGHIEDLEWDTLRFEEPDAGGGEQNSASSAERDEELIVIFPPIFLLEDGPPFPITKGVVLMKSQSAAAAIEEMERKKQSSPTAGKTMPRHKPNRSRTMSVSLNVENPFLYQGTSSGVPGGGSNGSSTPEGGK